MADSLVPVIVRAIEGAGFEVQAVIMRDACIFTAIDEATGERFTTTGESGDVYESAVELARLVGIELEDG